MNKVFLRGDGNSTIGLGHIYRLITIGQYLFNEYEVVFIIKNQPDIFLQNIIKEYRFSFIELPEFKLIGNEADFIVSNIAKPGSFIVLDGYQFNSSYEKILTDFGIRVILIDDLGNRKIGADAVLNHSPGADEIRYQLLNNKTKLYLGTNYAILREPFLKEALKKERLFDPYSIIFMSMGGADPQNLTTFFLNSLVNNPHVGQINVLIGGANKNDYSGYLNSDKIVFFKNLSPDEIIGLAKKCDLTICPSSTISIELISIGIPMLTGYFEENQKNIYSGLIKNKLAFPMGDIMILDDEKVTECFYKYRNTILISEIVKNQKHLLDGKSNERILNLFKDL